MADISAIKLPNGTTYNLKDTTARNAANSAVPNTRTVNGKALSSNISLGAGDVGAYTKSETDTKISAAVASAYKYKGSVTADKLPTSGQVVGDVYNITNDSSYGKAGMNVAWNGTTWDALGSNVDLSNYVTTSDSRLSNARPASDVYAWAKAASKPSYSASEISGLGSLATKNSLSAGDVGAVSKSGDIMTGNLTAPSFQTGTGNANYFQCRKFRGEGNADTYYHAVDFGYAGHDQVDFYEYGGKYVFHQHQQAAKSSGDTVIGEINGKGFVGKVNGHTINADVPADAKFTDTTYSVATSSTDGLMSAADKSKLDGIGAGSNVKSVNGKTGAVTLAKGDIGLSNVDNTADSAKSVKYATSAGSANSVAWGNVSGRPSSLPANGGNSSTVNGHTVNADVPSGAKFTDTTYSAATQSANGLMSAADKKKLDSYTTGSAGGAVEVTLAAASWSSSTTEINGNNYYTYSVSVANIGNQHPQIFCGGGDSVIPSATQESEFNHIRYALVDTAKSTVTFYSIEKPSVAINVVIKDYLESSIVSGTASVTIATSDWSSTTSTVNGRAFYTAKKTLSSVSSNYPTIICGTADTLPSDAEQTAFDCINYAAADTSTKTVTFYAIQKPASVVVAIVI